MRVLSPIALAVLFAGCAHAPRAEEVSELPPDTSFRVHPHLGSAESQLAVILSPPGELPVWSCTGTAKDGEFGCPVATDWYRGRGIYEVLVELTTRDEVIRSSRNLEVTEEGPLDLSFWLVEAPKPHLELAPGASGDRPSTAANGALSREAIRAEINKHRSGIRGCYAGALQDSPGLEARIETWFLIGADGTVQAASARGAAQHPELVYCLLAKVQDFQFPRPQGGALTVTYPFVFSPE